jgi:hypothetical protein
MNIFYSGEVAIAKLLIKQRQKFSILIQMEQTTLVKSP